MLRSILAAGGVLAVVVACSTAGRTDTPAGALASSSSSSSSVPAQVATQTVARRLPTFDLYYQQVDSAQQLSALGNVDNVVVTRQTDDAQTVRYIHSTGAKAYRYVQSYWYPGGSEYDGLNISQHRDWAFCKSGRIPLTRRQDGIKWYYLDANERAVRRYWSNLLARLKADHYDGVMLDRGLAALTGNTWDRPGIWDRKSTCTNHPVKRGVTFSDAYVGLMSAVHSAGLKLIANYGYSPFDPTYRLRPDPRDPACRAGKFATCRHLSDAKRYVDYFLDEGAHPKDKQWNRDFTANLANEHNSQFGGRVLVLITQATLGGDASKRNIFFEFAKLRLFRMPVAIFTGDDKCGGQSGLCNRLGVFPQLTNAQFGAPLGTKPTSTKCMSGSRVRCVWIRRYADGVVLANVSGRRVSVTVTLPGRTCRRVKDLYTGARLKNGACLTTARIALPAWSGRPLLLR